MLISTFYNSFKPFIYLLDPEWVHNMSSTLLSNIQPFLWSYNPPESLKVKFFDKELSSPIGLAAGMDKSGNTFPAFSTLGLSFSELGTFTPLPQQGNPKPRIHRFVQEKSIINKMGFNNPGLNQGLNNIEKNSHKLKVNHKIAISIGKAKNTSPEKAIDEYIQMAHEIQAFLNKNPHLASSILYLVLNVSSPNTPNLRDMQHQDFLTSIINNIKKVVDIPIMIKIAPDFQDTKLLKNLLIQALKLEVNGFILNNTSIDYSLLSNKNSYELAQKFNGGLSGQCIQKLSQDIFTLAHNILSRELNSQQYEKNNIILIATGGIMSPSIVWQRILLGASLVQVYTGLIYYGPNLIKDTCIYLNKKLKELGLETLSEVYQNRTKILNEIK